MTVSRQPSVSGDERHERGQSSPIGLVLVFAVMIAGSLTVVALGATAMDDTETHLSDQRAEKVMTQLDSEASLVALGRTDTQRVSFEQGSGDRYRVENQTGWMRINVTNKTTSTPHPVMDQKMGAILYDNDGTEIAYQGGGVWRKEGEGSTMLSPPEFHYRNATLTLPLVAVSGDPSLGSGVHINRNGTSDQQFPDPGSNSQFTNPLDNHEINVTVKSEYYEAWGRYFETRTEGDVVYDHPDKTATVTLVVPVEHPPVNAGVVAGAPGGTLEVDQTSDVDSYNSKTGPYVSGASNSKLIAAGDIDVKNNALIEGSVESGGWVNVSNNGEITGNAQYDMDIDIANNGDVDGWTAQNASVNIPNRMDSVIDSVVGTVEDSNNNSPAPIDSSDRLQGCSTTCELTAGEYYLDEIDLGSGDTLELNTNSGDITIAVDGDVRIMNGGQIKADNESRTNIYIAGDADIDEPPGSDPTVDVEKDNTPKLWFYMKSNNRIHFHQHSQFQGVVYGPGGISDAGVEITLDNQAEIWGALVGDVPNLDNHNILHYDEALKHSDSVQEFHDIPALTYLHVSVNRINVGS